MILLLKLKKDEGNEINSNKTIANKSSGYKTEITEIIGSTPDVNNTINSEGFISLKYLSNFWRFLDSLLINCEIVLDWSWSKKMYNF